MSRYIKSWHTLCLILSFVLTVFTGGCAEVHDPVLQPEDFNGWTYEEVMGVVQQLKLDNFAVIDDMSDDEKQGFIEAIEYFEIPHDDPGDGTMHANGQKPPPLPWCGGYWGARWEHEYIEQRDGGGYSYQVGPNCQMWALGDDCGPDHDDYMLSFYFGNHAENIGTLRSKLRWSSSNWWVQLTLGGTLDGRLYEQVPSGDRDNYQVYICIDDYFANYLGTLYMKKY